MVIAGALSLAGAGYYNLYCVLTQRESLRLSAVSALTVSAFAIANPVTLNKLQAGHLKFLLAYAMLPWIATASLDLRRSNAAWLLGLMLGIAAMDPQFIAFGLITAVAFSWYGATFSWRTISAAAVIAIAINLQQIVPAISPSAAGTFAAQSPVLFWQRSQSDNLSTALTLTGYIGGYAQKLLPVWLQRAYWLIPVSAILLPACRANRRLVPLGLLAAIGLLITCAWNTPLAFAWSFGFAHFKSLAVFRELYNAMALIVVSFAAGLTITLGVLLQRFQAIAYSLCGCIFLISVFVATNTGRNLPTYSLSASEARAMHQLDTRKGFFRFIAVPGSDPSADALYSSNGGLSPWFLPLDNHGSFFSAEPNDVNLYTLGLLRDFSPEANRWLIRDDVGFVKYLKGWRTTSIAQAEPSAKKVERRFIHDYAVSTNLTIVLGKASLVAVEPFSARPGSLNSAYTGTRDLTVIRGGVPQRVQNFYSDISPSSGWARTSLMPILPTWAYAEPTELFTLRTKAVLPAPAAWVIAGTSDGNVRSRGCDRVARLDAHFRLFNCSANPMFSGIPPIVISSVTAGGMLSPKIPLQGAKGIARPKAILPWRVTAIVHADPGSAVVLRQMFSAGWASSLPNAKHYMVDGYANAWVVPRRFDGIVTFTYTPAYTFFIALAASLASLLIVSAIVIATEIGRGKFTR